MANLDPRTWHVCLDTVDQVSSDYVERGDETEAVIDAVIARLRAMYPRPLVQGELDSNPARVAARRIEARRG